MKRVVVYDIKENRIENSSAQTKKNVIQNEKTWEVEKRKRAMKTIQNVSDLTKIVESIETLKIKDPNTDGIIVKQVVEKISNIVEEMRLEFKKDYWG